MAWDCWLALLLTAKVSLNPQIVVLFATRYLIRNSPLYFYPSLTPAAIYPTPSFSFALKIPIFALKYLFCNLAQVTPTFIVMATTPSQYLSTHCNYNTFHDLLIRIFSAILVEIQSQFIFVPPPFSCTPTPHFLLLLSFSILSKNNLISQLFAVIFP
jgi:hypothetical protein